MPERTHKKFIHDAAALYLGRGANMTIGLLSTFLYGVIFSKSGIAQISLFEMLVSFVLSLGFSWTTTGIVRFGKSEQLTSGTLHKTSSLRLSVLVPVLVVALPAVFFFEGAIQEYVGLSGDFIVWLLAINIILLVAHEHINYLQTTLEKHKKNVFYFLGLAFWKCAILLLLYFRIVPATPQNYLIMSASGVSFLLLARIPFLGKENYWPFVLPQREEVRKYLNFCLPQVFGFAGIFIINWIDLYFLRMHCSLEEIGAYQFLYSIFVKLASFSIILNTLFFPRVMAWKESNSENLEKYLVKAPMIVLLGVSLLVALFLPTYQLLFPLLFEEKFAGQYVAFNVLLSSLPFYFCSFILVPLLNGFDKVKHIQIVNILCASLNFVLDYFFVSKFGPIAAAYATLAAYFLKFACLKTIVDRLFEVKRGWNLSYLVIVFLVLLYSASNSIPLP